MRKFGYARVSTSQQCLNTQIKALLAEGIEEYRIFSDKKSGKDLDREGLDTVIMKMEKGDELFVHRLDRLGRDTADMLQIIKQLNRNDIHVTFIKERLTTRGEMGIFTITVLSAGAQAERRRMMERLMEGRVEAQLQGKKMGPKFTIDRGEVIRMKKERYGATEISKSLKIGRDSVYRILNEEMDNKIPL